MPAKDRKSPNGLTDVQRLFGDERLPDEVDVQPEGATSPADGEPGFGRDEAPPGHVPETVEALEHADAFLRGPVDLDEGPAPSTLLGVSWLSLERWFESLRNPPRPELVAAHAVLLVATIVGSRAPGGWVRPDDLLAVFPRGTVDEALRVLRYSGFLFHSPDGRFRVVGTPLKIAKENAA